MKILKIESIYHSFGERYGNFYEWSDEKEGFVDSDTKDEAFGMSSDVYRKYIIHSIEYDGKIYNVGEDDITYIGRTTKYVYANILNGQLVTEVSDDHYLAIVNKDKNKTIWQKIKFSWS